MDPQNEKRSYITVSPKEDTPQGEGAVASPGTLPNLRKERSIARLLVTLACCAAWLGASSSAILVNKVILVNLSFHYPTTLAWLGLVTTLLCSTVAVPFLVPLSKRHTLSRRQFLTQVLPAGFCMAITFTLGNTAYLYLTVAFIQMLKASCPVITMLLLFAFRLEKATVRLVVSVLIISGGVALASYGQINLNVLGLSVMMTSIVAECIRLVLTQYILVGGTQGMHPMEGLQYISAACTMCLMVQAALFEWHSLFTSGDALTIVSYPFSFFLSACAGFGVNTLAILVIKLTSSLTLKVLSTVKDAALVTVGVVLLHEHVSQLQLVGYVISLLGFTAYNIIQSMPQSKRSSPRALKDLLPVSESKST